MKDMRFPLIRQSQKKDDATVSQSEIAQLRDVRLCQLKNVVRIQILLFRRIAERGECVRSMTAGPIVEHDRSGEEYERQQDRSKKGPENPRYILAGILNLPLGGSSRLKLQDLDHYSNATARQTCVVFAENHRDRVD